LEDGTSRRRLWTAARSGTPFERKTETFRFLTGASTTLAAIAFTGMGSANSSGACDAAGLILVPELGTAVLMIVGSVLIGFGAPLLTLFSGFALGTRHRLDAAPPWG
jgi:hypothetical protein